MMADKLEGHSVRDPHDLYTRIDVQLDQAAEEVARRLGGKIDYQVVREAVSDAYRQLAGRAKFHSFLPILAARSAEQSLLDAQAS
ncbi:three-helix bundle dimerization domain-containing protein [Saccharothrix deserti]|uniref:three-helix bundle dimerization domain-containing protein n=1 Tax=Saccharothrix deserti TaxID=2593674 RepID=UPI00131D7C24|nr:hypothetical protein [Saccharothrix deserti]